MNKRILPHVVAVIGVVGSIVVAFWAATLHPTPQVTAFEGGILAIYTLITVAIISAILEDAMEVF